MNYYVGKPIETDYVYHDPSKENLAFDIYFLSGEYVGICWCKNEKRTASTIEELRSLIAKFPE